MATNLFDDSELRAKLLECLQMDGGAMSVVMALEKLALEFAKDQRDIVQDERLAKKWEAFAGAMRRAQKYALPVMGIEK
jgi:hypothetical protein